MWHRRVFAIGLLVAMASLIVACSSTPAAPAPTQAPAKPAAEPTKAPAAPAAQPTAAAKPAAQPTTAAAPAKPSGPVVELKAASGFDKTDLNSIAMNMLADEVTKRSNGSLVFRVYYQELGSEQQLAQSVSSGSVDLGMLTSGNVSRFSNAYYPFDLPFLFKDQATLFRSLDTATGKRLVAEFEKALGVKQLLATNGGPGRDVQTTKKQLKVPADIKGMKIRAVSTPVDLATFKAWGANPTPIDWGQTYTALQQGVVEGMNIGLGLLLSSKAYEVCKYSLRIEYQQWFQQIYVNQKKFDSLSPEHQKILVEAADATKPKQRQFAVDQVAKDMAELEKQGHTFYTPTAAERAEWTSIRDKVWSDVSAELKEKLDVNIAKELAATP